METLFLYTAQLAKPRPQHVNALICIAVGDVTVPARVALGNFVVFVVVIKVTVKFQELDWCRLLCKLLHDPTYMVSGYWERAGLGVSDFDAEFGKLGARFAFWLSPSFRISGTALKLRLSYVGEFDLACSHRRGWGRPSP